MRFQTILIAVAMSALASLPAPASAALYKFVQTGVSTTPYPNDPPPKFTASIEINGTLADMPTMNSHDLWPFDLNNPVAIDYGPLLALKISISGWNFAINLENFGYPYDPYFDDFPHWLISPDGLYFNSTYDEFWIEGFNYTSLIGHRSDGGVCNYGSGCEAPGRWVQVPEPGTVWMLFASLILLCGCAVRRHTRGAFAT